MVHISRLKWNGFGDELEKLVVQIRQALAIPTGGICVVTDVPINDKNAAFLSIANTLNGEILQDTFMPPYTMEANLTICRIEEDPLTTNEFGHSGNNQHFSFHTDCTHLSVPPEVMMLLCCRPAKEGGETILAHIDDILDKLSEKDKIDLSRMKFPWYSGPQNVRAPIITRSEQDGKWLIRFKQSALIREMGKVELTDAPALKSLFDILDSFEKDPNNMITLSAGDLLIVHNQRILHGRTAFSSGSSRLLKRLRMRLPDL